MDDAVKLSVVIPVYNEAGTIGEVIRRVLDCGFETEVIVVDDASTDDTARYLKSLEHPQVHCFYHAVNHGKGAALRLGFAAARNPYVIVQDADLEYDPRDYRQLLEALIDGRADMVYGSRFLGGPHRVLFFWHYVANRMLTLVANMMSNLNLDRHGDRDEGVSARQADSAQAQRQPFHLRARDNRQGGARRMANLRGADLRTPAAPTMRARRSAGATRSPRSPRSSTTGFSD